MTRTITKRKLHVLLWSIVSMMLISITSFGQNRNITGTVTDASDSGPLPGVSVKIKGASTGVSTDVNGKYSISAKTGDVLVFTSIAYSAQEIRVGNGNTVNVKLAASTVQLEEAVVNVGYGVQRKKLTTGANLQVRGEDIQKQSTTNALQALQGQTPGVQITSTSGQPGAGIRVVIRGRGTISDPGPLYVVDGLVGVDINSINPSDIESIDVLKDAASAAIYGSQAANGVILVTTKTGKQGQKSSLTFDTYAGVQQIARKADLLNAKEYATIYNESLINSGKAPAFSNQQIADLGTGTDWLDQMLADDASTQNFILGAQGSSGTSVYSTSLSYTKEAGIVGGEDYSNYKRYGARINSEHGLFNNVLKLGQHLNFIARQDNGIATGNLYFNSLRGAFTTSPLLKMYDDSGNYYNTKTSGAWNANEANPYAEMVYNNQNRNNNQNLFGDVYAVLEPIKGLTLRTTLFLNTYNSDNRSFQPIYDLSTYSFRNQTGVSQSMSRGRTLQFDNLLGYKFNLSQNNFEIMAGTTAVSSRGTGINGNNRDLTFPDFEHAYLSNATNRDITALGLSGSPWENNLLSYFGRFQYNFKETYLFNATFRADASSRFAANHRWGYFPSVSAGWILTNEKFLAASRSWLDYFKLRASFGQVGNQNISSNNFNAPISYSNATYSFGNEEGVLTTGAYQPRLGNPDLKWETSEQIDFGFDSRFLKGKLGVNFDYFVKTTKDWLIVASVPATTGTGAPFINGGNVKNSGIELALNYNSNVGKFNYNFGLNGAYLKNEVGQIPNASGIIEGNGVLFDNGPVYYRAENGYPIGYFRGYKTNGLFQTEADVNAYRSTSGKIIQPDAAPGDVKYADLNNDGLISDADKTMIGNPNPDYTLGLTLGGNFKGFDFNVLASGIFGNQIIQAWRKPQDSKANFSSAILARWHGPGTSTTIPRVTEDNRNWAQVSDLYVHNGDFFRISNVTLGYDLSKVIKKNYLSRVRVYAAAINLHTFTKYDGMDPEVGYGDGFSSGVDFGYYPRPRTLMLGANIRL